MTLREQLPCRECGHAALYHGEHGCTMVMPAYTQGVRTRWMCECGRKDGEEVRGGGDD